MKFFKDLKDRITGKTPWFFRKLRLIGMITGFIAGLPLALSGMGVTVPDVIVGKFNNIVLVAAITTIGISQLTKVEPETHPSDIPEKIEQIQEKAEENKI